MRVTVLACCLTVSLLATGCPPPESGGGAGEVEAPKDDGKTAASTPVDDAQADAEAVGDDNLRVKAAGTNLWSAGPVPGLHREYHFTLDVAKGVAFKVQVDGVAMTASDPTAGILDSAAPLAAGRTMSVRVLAKNRKAVGRVEIVYTLGGKETTIPVPELKEGPHAKLP